MSNADDAMRLSLDLANNVLIEACAGSGKTWLLTSRIIRALLDDEKLEPARILAITFTNAAKAEIEQRVHDRCAALREATTTAVDEALAQLYVQPTPSMRKCARGLYQRLVMAQPPLAVNTFHGWFMHLERGLPWAARTTLSRQIIATPQLAHDEAWSTCLAELAVAGSTAPASVALARLLKLHKPPQLQAMLTTLLDKRVAWELHFKASPADADACAEFTQQFIEANAPQHSEAEILADPAMWELLTQLNYFFSSRNTKTAKKLCAALQQALQVRDAASLRGAVRAALLTKKDELRRRLFSYDSQPQFTLRQQILDLVACHNWPTILAYNQDALTLGGAYLTAYERRKSELGVYDYSDIELMAVRTVRGIGFATLATRIPHTYRHILIDEFQDTSPVQWEVMREWLEVCAGSDLQPSVFIVGDPKQSIYSFQGGDPEVLKVAREYLLQNYAGKVVHQNVTRRCAPAVLQLVNQLFAGKLNNFAAHSTLQENLPGMAQLVEIDLVVTISSTPAADAPIVLRNPLQEPRQQLGASATMREGIQITDLLSNIIGKLQIVDNTGISRPCRPQDVMLLYPTRAAVAEIVRELARGGVPCGAPSGKNRLHELECADLIALLRAICDPNYALAVAQVLCSPICGVSTADMSAVAHAEGADWHSRIQNARGSKELQRAQQLLAQWRDAYLTAKLPAHETLAACFADAEIIARYVRAVPREVGKRVVRNLEWVLNYAIEAEGGRHVSVAEYADHLERLSGLDSFSTEAEVADDQVRAMTIHGAKGLESPVVVVSNARAKRRAEATAGLLVGWENAQSKRQPYHFSFFWTITHASAAQLACLRSNEEARQREDVNLLYVALTRAKQAVIVTAKGSTQQTLNWHELVAAALQHLAADETDTGWRYCALPQAALLAAEPRAITTLPQTTPVSIGELSTTVTYTRHGTLLHNMLALTLAGITDAAAQRAYLGVSVAQLAQLREKTDVILTADAMAALLAQRIDMELELQLVDKQGILRVDCLLTTADELWILDFKSAAQPKPHRYRKQMHRYRDALRATMPIDDKRLVRLALVGGAGGLVEMDSMDSK